MSTAVNKAGWMLVEGSRIHQPDLVAFVCQFSGSCTAANVMYCYESQILHALIFIWLVPNINAQPFIDSYSNYA